MKKKQKQLSMLLITLLTAATLMANGNQEESISPSSEISYGNTLVFSQSGPQYENDMYPPTAGNANIMSTARPALEPLFLMASDGTIMPHLVKEWKVSNDQLSYELKLQENVKFHDGTPFNAEAVKWNIEQVQAEGIHAVYNDVTSIDITDENTLVLHLSYPNLLFLGSIASVQASMMVSPSAVKENGKEWAKLHPVGTGPFKLVSWEPNVKMIFTKNEEYWQEGLPYLDGMEFHAISDDVVLSSAFQMGEVMMVRGISSQLLQELTVLSIKNNYDSTVYSYPNAAFNLWPSSKTEGSPFQDPRVRKAVACAIDMNSIVTSLNGPETGYTNQLSYPESPWYNPEIEGNAYDVEKAKKLLAEAGYPDGFETKLIIENNQANATLAEAIQAYLFVVGIKLNIDLTDSARYVENVILNSWGDGMAAIAYFYTPEELSSMKRMLNPETSIFRHTVDYPETYKNMLNEMLSQKTKEAAIAQFKDVDAYLIDEQALVIPVSINHYASVTHHFVHNTGSGMDGEVQVRSWTPEKVWLGE